MNDNPGPGPGPAHGARFVQFRGCQHVWVQHCTCGDTQRI
jgi:hypothetical protein